MKAIVISKGQITIGSDVINSLKFRAKLVDILVVIYSTVSENILCQGAAADLSLNGTTYATENEFIIAFNLAIQNADINTNVAKNTGYPDTPFSAKLTPNVATRVANYAKPGWVTIKASINNGGNVYVGPTGLIAGSGELEPGESITYEANDLSTIWALNVSAGYIINVFGNYKN
jgi:hypothetical protein